MGPIVKELVSSHRDKSVKFVTFDFTSDESKKAGKALAETLGVAGTYAKNAPNTGFALFYNTKSQKVVTKLSAEDETSKWAEAIDTQLGG